MHDFPAPTEVAAAIVSFLFLFFAMQLLSQPF